jgi:hypothetical protein
MCICNPCKIAVINNGGSKTRLCKYHHAGSGLNQTGVYLAFNPVGQQPYSAWVFEQIYDATGQPIVGAYVDRNNDGKINNDDRHYVAMRPNWTYGFSTAFNYKNWDLTANFRGQMGGQVYNLKTLTKYDATTKKAGDLQGDGTAVTLLSVLNTMISATGPAASSTFSYLSDVGIQVQSSGLLSTSSSTLTTAFDSLDDLKTFFYNYGGTTSTNGLARRFRDFVWDANGVEGTLSLKKTALSEAITRNETSQDKFSLRIAEMQKRLYKQYGGLDSRMGGLNGLSSFVSAQVAQWNKN